MTEDIAYWIALSSLPGIGPVTFRRLCERFGTPENVFQAARAEPDRPRGLRPETIAALRRGDRHLSAARKTARELDRDGFDAVTFAEARYPAPLRDLKDAPAVLYTRGRLPGPDARTFSVAGSTYPSARGANISRSAGRELAEAGWTVVSGYALGIDSAAHAGALEEGGHTVLVLPMGIRAFELRPEFKRFRDELGGRMVLISERPPNEAWSSRSAVLRDRIIAALGRALLVVEARPDSGTMITFRHALRLGRPAYVVKYRRSPPGASGNRLAIRAGGVPVESMKALRDIARAPELPTALPRAAQGELF